MALSLMIGAFSCLAMYFGRNLRAALACLIRRGEYECTHSLIFISFSLVNLVASWVRVCLNRWLVRNHTVDSLNRGETNLSLRFRKLAILSTYITESLALGLSFNTLEFLGNKKIPGYRAPQFRLFFFQ